LILAKVLLEIEEEDEYIPVYTYDEDLDPNNLPGEQEQIEMYLRLARQSQPSIQCYECHNYGHTKSKYGVWNCSACEDPWAKKDNGGPPVAVVQDICREIYDGPGRHHGKPALGNFVWNYLDDCAIVAANDEEATHLYRWLFTKFAERGLTVRASKSGLYLKQITFVGHICDEHGVHADPKKVEAISLLTLLTFFFVLRDTDRVFCFQKDGGRG
jgi:ribosomal protein L37AE/L43A